MLERVPMTDEADGGALAAAVAERLKKLIAKKGKSFERLAEFSGIDPEELLKIEAGSVTPTIDSLWRIANALGAPFGSLVASSAGRSDVLVIRGNQNQIVSSSDGNFRARPLFPYDCKRPVEFYEILLAGGHIEHVEAHVPGTRENLVVARGAIEVSIGKEAPEVLHEGDAVNFLADVPHSYRNILATPATAFLVMSYDPAPCDGAT